MSPTTLPWRPVPLWDQRWPWLLAGVTHPGDPTNPFDLRLFGAQGGGGPDRWRVLREEVGFSAVVHAPQVHGTEVLEHGALPPGLLVTDAADGHVTHEPDVLLTVSVADCVPVFLVDPERRALGLLHAGRKGVAAGILGIGLGALSDRGTSASSVHVHLGPAICGACYEVGPEVHAELGLTHPRRPAPVDLRAILSAQARAQGVREEHLSISDQCTLCSGEGTWFSHRAGSAGRQVALLGIRG